MNLSYKQINTIRKHTPKELKGKSLSVWDVLGYFTPSGANWSYVAGFAEYKGQSVLVVTQFGHVV